MDSPMPTLIAIIVLAALFILLYFYIPIKMADKRNRSALLCVLLTFLVDPLVAYIIIAIIGKK